MPTRNNPVIRSALSESAFFQRLKAKAKKVEVDETEYYILVYCLVNRFKKWQPPTLFGFC